MHDPSSRTTPDNERPLLEHLRSIPVASLADAMDAIAGRTCFMRHDMRPLFPCRIAGPATTVALRCNLATDRREYPPLMLDVLDEAPAGSVMVMSIEDGLDVAGIGGLMSTTARLRGLEAAVIDGAARDVEEIRRMGFPVFSRSISPASFIGRRVAFARDVEISCGGIGVRPGDWIVGDSDGVLVIPPELAAEAVRHALDYERRERDMMQSIAETGSARAALARHGRF